MRSIFAALGIGMLTLGCASYEPLSEGAPVVETEAALDAAEEVVVYRKHEEVPRSELVELNPADFGGIVGSDVTWYGRIDIAEEGLIGGVWQATRGHFSVLYPGALHGTVQVGRMILTDEAGSYELKPGDSFLVTKGTLLEYDIEGPMVQASFLGNFTTPDAPGPIVVHRKGEGASEDEMTYVGGADAFNGTLLDGELAVYARVDYLAGPTFAGIFKATRSEVLLDPVMVTEHGAVLSHGMNIVDNAGVTHRLRQGDSFIIRRGSRVVWDIKGHDVEESFFSVRATPSPSP